jgi:trk system potassium uptake protein
MNMIVVGCGRIGSELAYRLFLQGHEVTVVDSNEQAFDRLNPNFRGRTVTGEILARDVMERAGIDKADGLAAVTNSDTLNAVVAHTARTIFHIPNVIVRNYDPNLCPVLELFGLKVVSSTSWGAQRIEELLSNPSIHAVFSPGNGDIEIYEVNIPDQWNGKPLEELLSLPGEYLPVTLTRAGCSMLPRKDTLLRTGDLFSVSATAEGIVSLRILLFGKEV